MVQTGDIIKVNIRRYRDSDDKGIGILSNGKLVLVNNMNGENSTVFAKVTKVMRETIIASRTYEEITPKINNGIINGAVKDDKPKSIHEAYGYEEETEVVDDDDYEEYDEDN